MGSLTNDSIGRILEFTVTPDRRKQLQAYGFFVELDGEIGILQSLYKINAGQIKVPAMLTDPVTLEWLAERVIIEV